MGARLNFQVEATKDADGGTGRVSEMNIIKVDMAFAVFEYLAFGRFRVDFGLVVEKIDNF